MLSNTIPAREARARRGLARDGYRLVKCRRGYGGYNIIDWRTGGAMLAMSADQRGYDAPLEWVEDWLAE